MRLENFKRDVYSQWGEDGIIAKVFEIIPPDTGWCVEFGAWDGKYHSNTHRLIIEEEWSGVLIEADRSRFPELLATYARTDRVHCVNSMVDTEGPRSLDNILAGTPVPNRFDLLSIDIDGNDFHVWRSLTHYSPTLVVIEFNPTIPPDVEWVQPADSDRNQGASLRALATLGRSKGYELVAVTDTNAFFVRDELYARFGIVENAPEALFTQTKYLTRVFQLYDGTLIWSGCDRLLWADVPISPERFQLLPRFLRFQPGPRHSRSLRLLRHAYLQFLRWRHGASSRI